MGGRRRLGVLTTAGRAVGRLGTGLGRAAAALSVQGGSRRNAAAGLDAMAAAVCDGLDIPARPDTTTRPAAAAVRARGEPGLRHRLLAHAGMAEFLDQAVPFLRDGLAAGDRVLVISDAATDAALRPHLPATGDIDLIEAHVWYQTPGHAMATAHEYLRQHEPGRGLRILGQPQWAGRTAAEMAEWACYESAFNLAFADLPVQVVCPYDTSSVPGQAMRDAPRTHPEVAGGGASGGYVDPCAFVPRGAPRLRPAPESAATARFQGRDLASVTRFVTRQAFDAGVFGSHARTLAVAAHEAVRDLAPQLTDHGTVRVWAEPHDLVCEITVQDAASACIAGYLPPHLRDGDDRGLWLARQLCRLVHVRPAAGGGTVVRLTYPRAH